MSAPSFLRKFRPLTSVLLILTALTGCGPAKTADGLRDIPYQTDGHARQKLDLYLPKDPRGAPVVLWIHGGGWEAGDKGRPPIIGLRDMGYVVASTNYRYSRQAPFPAQLQDVKAAVRWLRAHAQDHGYDGSRIGVWGHSAGGTLVELLGVTGDQRQFDIGDNAGVSSAVQAVVGMSGPSDFNAIIARSLADGTAQNPKAPVQMVARFLGKPLAEAGELATQASPVTYASPRSAPMLLVHGVKDTLVPIIQSERMVAAMQKAGGRVQLLALPEADHGRVFDADTVAQAVRFLQENLRSGR